MKLPHRSTLARKVLAGLTAMATLSTVALGVTPQAQAAPRDHLRVDANGTCEWDPVQYWVQRCEVYSAASGRVIEVQIQPAQRGGNGALYLLAGAAAGLDGNNNWMTTYGNAPAQFVDSNITLVAPVGGAGTFYTDWIDPTGKPTDAWETFLTVELPDYLERNFGVSRTNNSVLGMSMGGTAAMSLAARYPQQFQQVLSYSGYLALGGSVGNAAAAAALTQFHRMSVTAVYSTFMAPDTPTHDPLLNIPKLRNTEVYVSAATGIPSPADLSLPIDIQARGAAMEVPSLAGTSAWDGAARAAGLNVTSNYQPTGLHNWNNWRQQLELTRDRILTSLNGY